MILTFRHKGLKKFFENGDAKGLPAQHLIRIRLVLTVLDTISELNEINIPGGNLHPLKGDRKGQWSLTIKKNWRITFRFENGDAFDLDYEDYH